MSDDRRGIELRKLPCIDDGGYVLFVKGNVSLVASSTGLYIVLASDGGTIHARLGDVAEAVDIAAEWRSQHLLK